MAPVSSLTVCYRVIFPVFDTLQLCVCCIRSGVTLGIHFVVHCLCLLWQCVSHEVLFSVIGVLMHLIAAEPHSGAGLLYINQRLNGTILMAVCLMVWDWPGLRARSMLLCWPELLTLFPHWFLILYLPSVWWLCGVVIFGLMRCIYSLPASQCRFK